MAIELIAGRESWVIPAQTESVRVALSWRRNGGGSLRGHVTRVLGMNLDLVVAAHNDAENKVEALFLPPGLDGYYADWLWHLHDEQRGGKAVWDESAVVHLGRVPGNIHRLSFAITAFRRRTSFDGIPDAVMDVYDSDSSKLLVQTQTDVDRRAEDADINLIKMVSLVRSGDGWAVFRAPGAAKVEQDNLDSLTKTMEKISA